MGQHFLYVQEWTESEAGWGFRPDGLCAARDREDLKEFVSQHLDKMRAYEKERYGDRTPPEYSYPNSEGIIVLECSEAVYNRVDSLVCWFRYRAELLALA